MTLIQECKIIQLPSYNTVFTSQVNGNMGKLYTKILVIFAISNFFRQENQMIEVCFLLFLKLCICSVGYFVDSAFILSFSAKIKLYFLINNKTSLSSINTEDSSGFSHFHLHPLLLPLFLFIIKWNFHLPNS